MVDFFWCKYTKTYVFSQKKVKKLCFYLVEQNIYHIFVSQNKE